jgi:phosphoribosyl 1,2-cyclic phosphodiesterase
MDVTLWGTRGSLATPGPETIRYGGNTSCVEVRTGPQHMVVLDAGTGVRRLGRSIGDEVQRVDILLTHFHLDHVQGLGFFAPLFRPTFDVHVWGPGSKAQDLETRLACYLSPPLFPVRLRDLPCHLTLHNVLPGSFALPGLDVAADLVCHSGRTVGYRLSDAAGVLAYLPDHELAVRRRSGLELVEGADVLIHDAQYTAGECETHAGWGHSSIDQAVAFACEANVGTLIAFHHDPAHDDEAVDRLLAEGRRGCDRALQLVGGIEGASLSVHRNDAFVPA